MCAIFTIKTASDKVRVELNIDPSQELPDPQGRFLPYSKAPVAVASKDANTNSIHLMNFSLVPSWSKTPKVKFATHNARLDTILEKPTWKKPFLTKHCLVPISEFIESITEVGKSYAGNMVRFSDAHNQLLVAAGIYDEWVNPETGEIIESFAILTDEPPAFVEQIGHDRCPVFLAKKHYNSWLRFKGSGPEILDFLRESRQTPELQVEIDRALKAGWEKRAQQK